MPRTPGRGPSGFTMIELMVTVAVLALLAALAAPSMQKLVAAQKLRSASYDLVADFTLARSEALKRAATVQVTPTSSDWRNGWTMTTGTTVLSQRNAIGTGLTATCPTATASFDASGRFSSATLKFGFEDSFGRARCITLDPTGRPKSVTSACTCS
jgi:type IV fimbrial biogenesis protein FimT